MKEILVLLSLVLTTSIVTAQNNAAPDSMYFISLNQQIDTYVVQRNVRALDTLYATDFVFSHGTGFIEGKPGWLSAVEKNSYLSRRHDSVTVEPHPGLAILRGKLSIQRKDNDQLTRYNLKYVRVYAVRNKRWQMISHITTHEQHE
jgi:hypothetical protein